MSGSTAGASVDRGGRRNGSILLVSAAGYVSGREIMSLELIEGMRDLGIPTSAIISTWSDGDFRSRLLARGHRFEEMPLGFYSTRLSMSHLGMTFDQLVRLPALYRRYSRCLRRERPGCVLHTNWQHVLLLYPWLRLNRDRLWVHEVVPSKERYGRLFRRLSRRIESFVCVSNAVRASLLELGLAAEKVVSVPNGISDPAVGPEASRSETIGPVGATELSVGIVGQLDPSKGHGDLIEAMSLVGGREASVRLHVFGGGSATLKNDLERKARDLGVADRIVWEGFQADRARIYRHLDCCVVPSTQAEGFGLTALEPAFFGIPVIATRAGGLEEVVVDGVTGLLVSPNAPKEIADGLMKLAGDAVLRERLGDQARVRARREFTRSLMCRRLAESLSIGIESSSGCAGGSSRKLPEREVR